MNYKIADATWFSQCEFGIAAHWTAQSLPRFGEPLPFDEAVANFDAESFVERIANIGARYLLFTSAHALQMLPAPCNAIDELAPGRTCRRDLLGDLMRACQKRDLHFLLYYNHSCNHGDDPEWENAVGYHGADKNVFADNICRIVAELGERYGEDLKAWWFDSSYSVDPRGPVNMVSTDLKGWQFPWENLAAGAKAGAPQRLVTFNAGMTGHERSFLYSDHQDYLAGEVNDLVDPPTARFGVGGLQEHRWVCLDNSGWVRTPENSRLDSPLASPRYTVEEVANYLRQSSAHGVPVTFNLDIAQGGEMNPDSLETVRLAALRARSIA